MRVSTELLTAFYEGRGFIRRASWPKGDHISADGAEGGTIWYYDAEDDELTAGYRLGFHELGSDDWEIVSSIATTTEE